MIEFLPFISFYSPSEGFNYNVFGSWTKGPRFELWWGKTGLAYTLAHILVESGFSPTSPINHYTYLLSHLNTGCGLYFTQNNTPSPILWPKCCFIISSTIFFMVINQLTLNLHLLKKCVCSADPITICWSKCHIANSVYSYKRDLKCKLKESCYANLFCKSF